MVRTDTGFRLSTIKLSARCIMNRVNLLHRMRSISSACLILMLSLIELIEGSIRTLSFSFRDMIRGFRRTSLDVLEHVNESLKDKVPDIRAFDLWLIMPFNNLVTNL